MTALTRRAGLALIVLRGVLAFLLAAFLTVSAALWYAAGYLVGGAVRYGLWCVSSFVEGYQASRR